MDAESWFSTWCEAGARPRARCTKPSPYVLVGETAYSVTPTLPWRVAKSRRPFVAVRLKRPGAMSAELIGGKADSRRPPHPAVGTQRAEIEGSRPLPGACGGDWTTVLPEPQTQEASTL
jgi:hypothetical protein